MNVRLLTDRCWCGRIQYAGQVYEIPDRDARALIATRQAESVPPVQPIPRNRGRNGDSNRAKHAD